MIKKELTEKLAGYKDDTIIYIEADHEQMPEQAGGLQVTKDEKLPYSSEDMA